MRKIKCPFQNFLDQELPLTIIFDTLSIREDVTKYVGKIITYICTKKSIKGSEIILNIIRANIGQEKYDLFKKSYIDTYNIENKTIKRYFYLYDEKDLFNIVDAFNIIYSLSPVLNNIALHYRKEKNNE